MGVKRSFPGFSFKLTQSIKILNGILSTIQIFHENSKTMCPLRLCVGIQSVKEDKHEDWICHSTL